MSRTWNLLMQVVLFGCQLMNQSFDVLPIQEQHRTIVLLALAFIQGAIGIVAHSYNVDGTSQFTAYQPPGTIATIKSAKMILFFLISSFIFNGCATKTPGLFSGKAVVEFDQGQLFLTYIKINRVYPVLKYQIIEACGAKALSEKACEAFAESDKLIIKAAEEVEQGLVNPSYPVDMNKVQTFIDLTLATLVKVGVKGVTAGVIP